MFSIDTAAHIELVHEPKGVVSVRVFSHRPPTNLVVQKLLGQELKEDVDWIGVGNEVYIQPDKLQDYVTVEIQSTRGSVITLGIDAWRMKPPRIRKKAPIEQDQQPYDDLDYILNGDE